MHNEDRPAAPSAGDAAGEVPVSAAAAAGSTEVPDRQVPLAAGVDPALLPDAAVAVPAAPGRTTISEAAVAKVAAVAARSVPGVYTLGSGTARALSALRDVVGGSDAGQGVHVEVGQTQVAVDINLVAVYGKPLHELAASVRAAVYTAVEQLVGLDVVEVNVEINDVHVPGLDPKAPAEKPVRQVAQ
ncbi:Asp23/Gls24 family envelope stress response protein [Arthrobacter sulfonylureivorans]|uniref:Asp23/Gls24 family envelope stress response protein n=1 Tax=Arthrobacter sulfonylureivorans TaxID=2486855 RepID=UPI0039E34005